MYENDKDDECDPRHPADKTPQSNAKESNQTSSSSTRINRKDDYKERSTSNSSLQLKLFHEIEKPIQTSLHKVSIVGTGAVGMACAFSVLTKNLTGELALKDLHEEKVRGEMMDLQHGAAFIKSARIIAGADPEVTANSRIIIITAGVRQKEGEDRLSLLRRNLDILRPLVPKLVSLSPDAVIIVVSNPVDILTYFTWKLSGLPPNKVIGSGTNLDTSRFRFLISQKLNVAVESCHGWIIGEHGDSSVPVWSGVNIAGIPIKELYPTLGTDNDPDNWQGIHETVVSSAYEIIKLKGYTSWGIGLSVSNLVETILRNTHKVHAVSTNIKGIHGINDEVYLSVPCVLGENGVTHIVKQQLTQTELDKLHKSAEIMRQSIESINKLNS